MYDVQDWAEVHRLFHRERWSKTAIAEKLEMSRNTVDRLLSLSAPPRYERTKTVSTCQSLPMQSARRYARPGLTVLVPMLSTSSASQH